MLNQEKELGKNGLTTGLEGRHITVFLGLSAETSDLIDLSIGNPTDGVFKSNIYSLRFARIESVLQW